jgi:DNA-binding response OmpR family regulator
VIILLAATWPERALIRAQLAQDTGLPVVGTDSCESAIEWLATTPFALAVVDTQGLVPDPRLVDALRARGTPVLLLTGSFNQAEWNLATAELDVKEMLVRPMLIADLTRAAARLLLSLRAIKNPPRQGRSWHSAAPAPRR